MRARIPRNTIFMLVVCMLTACSAAAPAQVLGNPAQSQLSPTVTVSTQQPDTLESLRRRTLQLPTLAPGQPCPRAQGRIVSPEIAPAIGHGPIYAAGLGEAGILDFGYPPPKESGFYGSEWSGQKVLWAQAPSYRGPVLIRGRQLDGPNELRFSEGKQPPLELWLRAYDATGNEQLTGWRYMPSYTRLRAPGCYAYQVDGQGFSDIIIFEARPSAPR